MLLYVQKRDGLLGTGFSQRPQSCFFYTCGVPRGQTYVTRRIQRLVVAKSKVSTADLEHQRSVEETDGRWLGVGGGGGEGRKGERKEAVRTMYSGSSDGPIPDQWSAGSVFSE